MNVPADTALLPCQADLVHNLLDAPVILSLGHIQPSEEMALFGILLGPPLQQHRETVFFRLDGPIKLWGKVIYPAIHKPFPGIGVKSSISINGMRIDSQGNSGPPDTKRANAEFH